MRLAITVCVLGVAAGCTFDAGGFAGAGDAAAGDAAAVDAAAVDAATVDAVTVDAVAAADASRADAPAQGSVDASAVEGECPADDDLMACWRFEVDEHASQPWDDSMYGNHGTAIAVGFVPGHSGTALSVDENSSVRVPDSASLDVPETLTVELWLRARALPVTSRAGLVDDNGQYGLFLTSTGQVRCAVSSTTVTGLAVEVDRWTHLACVYDGATVTLYQDGVAGAAVYYSGPISTSATDGVAIGQNSPSGDPLDGLLDTVRVWRSPRTPLQLCQAAETCDGARAR